MKNCGNSEKSGLRFLSLVSSTELGESNLRVDSENTNNLDTQLLFYHIFYFKFIWNKEVETTIRLIFIALLHNEDSLAIIIIYINILLAEYFIIWIGQNFLIVPLKLIFRVFLSYIAVKIHAFIITIHSSDKVHWKVTTWQLLEKLQQTQWWIKQTQLPKFKKNNFNF